MMWTRCRWGAVIAATALGSGAWHGALVAQGPPPEVREAVDALVRTLEQGSEASARAFVEARLTPEYRRRLGDGAVRHVASLQQATRGAHGNVGLERSPDGSMRMTLSGSHRVVLTLVLDPESGRFDRIDLVTGEIVGGPGLTAAANDHLMALEVLAPTDSAVAEYRARRLAPGLRARAEQVDPQLLRAARAAQSASMVMSGVEGPYHLLRLRGGGATVTVRILVGETPPHLIEELSVEEGGAR